MEQIILTSKDLLEHTDDEGTCYLSSVLLNKINVDRNSPDDNILLTIDQEITVCDIHELLSEKSIKKIHIKFMQFNGKVSINPSKIPMISKPEWIPEPDPYVPVDILCSESMFQDIQIYSGGTVSFSRCIVKGSVNINYSQLQNSSFESCTFKGEVMVYPLRFEKTHFTDLQFEYPISFIKAQFTKCHFTNVVFHKKADFRESTLIRCEFERTEFRQKADFRYATLENNTFQNTEFHQQGAFYEVTFKGESTFHNLILKDTSHLYFENLNPDESDLSIEKFSLTNTIINGRVDFSQNIIKCLDLKDSVILGTLTRRNFNPECANWETATILKNEELKQNNIVRALKYKAIEKDLYAKWLKYATVYFKWSRKSSDIIDLENNNKIKKLYNELCKIQEKYQIPKNTIIIDENISLWQIRFDRLSLWMSYFFNNHGQSWGRGVVVTLGVWFICFGMFYMLYPYYNNGAYQLFTTSYWNSFANSFINGEFFSQMMIYFNPTNYNCLISYFKDLEVQWYIKVIGVFFYLLGKALVPYGIYEVVQAFRKYNKIN